MRTDVLASLIILASLPQACSAPSAPTPRPAFATEITTVEDVAPLELDTFEGYPDLVRRVLLDGVHADTWIVTRPSFRNESALALVAPDEPSQPWTITVVEASIWGAKKFEHGDEAACRALGPDDFDVSRRSMSVAPDLAAQISAAWRAVVRRARNPAPVYEFHEGARYERTSLRFDGDVHEFAAAQFYGRTWSPENGPAAEIVALAESLRDAVYSDPWLQDERIRMCAAAARDLCAEVEALPW